MPEFERTLVVGMPIDELSRLIDRHSDRLFEDDPSVEDGGRVIAWSPPDRVARGQVHLRSRDEASTFVHIEVEGEDDVASETAEELLHRLSGALEEHGGADRASYIVEPEPGAPAQARTSAEQPL